VGQSLQTNDDTKHCQDGKPLHAMFPFTLITEPVTSLSLFGKDVARLDRYRYRLAGQVLAGRGVALAARSGPGGPEDQRGGPALLVLPFAACPP
jgi:hypothetical protein